MEPSAGTPRHLILGTAGHIDHGKTALIRALTGTNTDRLPEERRRGMTIELGFAELILGSVHFGIVDVPGHERFVRTMVAGATGIDMALIVVAGDDSVMPQTVEHVEVLRLVGIEHAVVVVTKADLVDDGLLELVEEEVRELLKGTRLEVAPIVPVSSVTGTGLDVLRRQLSEVAARIPRRTTRGPFRMAVDRVFTVQGRG
ncbi:MAG: GTP-binding protein, partial [Gemmatimonadota bacterium]